MFGSIGGPELLLIFVLALLLFGPRKLPEIGKTIGRTLAEFKRATSDFTSSLEREVEIEKLREVKADVTNPLKAIVPFTGSGTVRPAAGPSAGAPEPVEPPADPVESRDGSPPDANRGGDGRRDG